MQAATRLEAGVCKYAAGQRTQPAQIGTGKRAGVDAAAGFLERGAAGAAGERGGGVAALTGAVVDVCQLISGYGLPGWLLEGHEQRLGVILKLWRIHDSDLQQVNLAAARARRRDVGPRST